MSVIPVARVYVCYRCIASIALLSPKGKFRNCNLSEPLCVGGWLGQYMLMLISSTVRTAFCCLKQLLSSIDVCSLAKDNCLYPYVFISPVICGVAKRPTSYSAMSIVWMNTLSLCICTVEYCGINECSIQWSVDSRHPLHITPSVTSHFHRLTSLIHSVFISPTTYHIVCHITLSSTTIFFCSLSNHRMHNISHGLANILSSVFVVFCLHYHIIFQITCGIVLHTSYFQHRL